MSLPEIVFWSLAVWRLTVLFVYDGITAPIRDRAGVRYDEHSEAHGTNFVSSMLACHRCFSVWAAGFIALLFIRPEPLTFVPIVLVLSAGSIILNKVFNDG